MKDQNEFGEKTRYEMRKKRNMNRILNTSIVVVGALILFFAAQLFLSGDDQASEEELKDAQEETTDNVQDNEDVKGPEDPPINEKNPVDNSNNDNESNTEDTTSKTDDDDAEDAEETQTDDPTGEGKWEPIGTEQTGSYHPDFNKGSKNWQEMERALQYATGLNEEEIIVWWLENGGGNTAIGTVSNKSNQTEPYRVTMKFIENKGWKPVKVEVLDSNPYLG